MKDLLIQPDTKAQLQAFISQPKHALLISGSNGAGKNTLATYLGASVLDVAAEKLANHSYFYLITKPDDKDEISIDSIRQLITKISLRVPSGKSRVNKIARVVLIQDAENLSQEAQNALLKLLEEPPVDTLIILTSESESSVLPTVASRAQKINVLPVGLDDSLGYFKSNYQPAAIESAWRLSGGSTGLLSALLSDDTEHPLKIAVDSAKKFLSQTAYHRLIYLKELSKDKQQLYLFMDALARVLSALQANAANSGHSGNTKRLLRSRRVVLRHLESMQTNANIRLLTLSLVVNMPL